MLPPPWIQRLWIQRVTGMSSILGSSLIIYMILSDRKRKLVRPYHRIMLLMSLFDVIQTMSMVVSYTAFPLESHFLGAKGNSCTCMAQSFCIVLGYGVPLYNSCLNIYYVLTIRYNITSEQFAKLEPILHVICILVPFSMAIILNMFDDVAPLGLVCQPRGKLSMWTIRLLFSYCFMACITSMICICWTVTSQANKMRNYTSSARRSRVEDDRKKTIKQAFLYSSAFILTYVFPLIGSAYTKGMADVPLPNTMTVLICIFYPLQGFWNFVFYIRPGVQRTMKTNPSMSYLGAARDVIFNPTIVETTQRQVSVRRRSAIYSIAPKRIVEPACEPVVTNSLSINTSEDNYIKSSSDKVDLALTHQELLNVTSSTCDSSESREDNITHDLELQFEVSPQPNINRRRDSLMSISSILNGEDSSIFFDDLSL